MFLSRLPMLVSIILLLSLSACNTKPLQERISQLETSETTLGQRVASLESEKNASHERIGVLEVENANFRKEAETLQRLADGLSKEKSNLEQRLSNTESELKTIRGDATRLTTIVDGLQKDKSKLEQSLLDAENELKAKRDEVTKLATAVDALQSGGRQIMPPTIDTPKEAATLNYDNNPLGVRIKYLADWSVRETSVGSVKIVAFVSPKESVTDNFQENLMIQVESLPGSVTLEQYNQVTLTGLKKFVTDFAIIESNTVVLANSPAQTLVFTGRQGEYSLKISAVWTIKNKTAYALIYTSDVNKYNAFMPFIEKMVNSFEIMGPVQTS